MKGLLNTQEFIDFEASKIEVGIFDEPDILKFALFNSDDKLMHYVFKGDDDYYSIIDFDESTKPADYEPYKYKYINGEFVLNPDWVEPPMPIEEQVSNLAESVEELEIISAESEEALCDIDLSYSQRIADIEEALCELAELLS